MKYTIAAAGITIAGIAAGAGGTMMLHAATGPAVYAVYEATVKDEEAYAKALPDIQKIIKETGGTYVAGGFNKAKLDMGQPAVGNRYVIVRWEDEATFEKYWNGGGKDWITKNAPDARQVRVPGIEAK